MKFDLTTIMSAALTRTSSNAPGSITTARKGLNKRTGAYVTQFGTNDGRSVTRMDTPSGCVLGRVCYIDRSQPPAVIRQQIKEAYRCGFTQQEIADASGYAQSSVSRIINEK